MLAVRSLCAHCALAVRCVAAETHSGPSVHRPYIDSRSLSPSVRKEAKRAECTGMLHICHLVHRPGSEPRRPGQLFVGIRSAANSRWRPGRFRARAPRSAPFPALPPNDARTSPLQPHFTLSAFLLLACLYDTRIQSLHYARWLWGAPRAPLHAPSRPRLRGASRGHRLAPRLAPRPAPHPPLRRHPLSRPPTRPLARTATPPRRWPPTRMRSRPQATRRLRRPSRRSSPLSPPQHPRPRSSLTSTTSFSTTSRHHSSPETSHAPWSHCSQER